MKKVLLVLFCVLCIFTVFSCTMPSSSKGTPNTDLPDPSLFRQQDKGAFFIETEDCYYRLWEDKVYFSEKESPAFFLLCNKPNCKHNENDCNAHSESALGYWNGHLYGAILFGGDMHLFQMNLDGSEHKRVADIEMPLNPAGTAGGGYDFYFHNGYAYYSVTNEGLNAFFQVDLATGKTKRVLEDLLRSDTWIGSGFHFVGTKFYFVLREEDGSSVMYGGDTEAWEYRRICNWPSEIRAWMVEDDTLYYYAKNRGVFCEYDLNTGKEIASHQTDYYDGSARYDSEYIYLTTWDDDGVIPSGLSIFDRSYQLLRRIEQPGSLNFLYDAQDKLIFTDLPSQKATKYLPKSAIGTGETELLPIEDPYSYR